MKLAPGWIIGIAYGLVCVLAAGWLGYRWYATPVRHTEVTLVAARPLPASTLLTAADLIADAGQATVGDATMAQARKQLEGRYLKDAVARQQKVGLAQTTATPVLMPPDGTILIGVPLMNETAAQALPAGTPALLCSGDKPIGAASYTVTTTRCVDGQCTGYIEVPSRAAENGGIFQAGLPPRLEPSSCLPHAVKAED